MKTLRTLIVIALAVFFAGQGLAQQPAAPTVTFNVPVQFNELNEGVTNIKIYCSLRDNQNPPRQVGQGESYIYTIPPEGNINTTVSVVAHQYMDFDITTAVTYSASFQIIAGDGATLQPSEGAERIEARAKTGTPFTRTVDGPINW